MRKKILTTVILLFVFLTLISSYTAYKLVKHSKNTTNKTPAKLPEISITIIEGWNNIEIAEYLEKQQIISSADFLNNLKIFNAGRYEKFIPKEANKDLQGFLYPDTYRLYSSITDRTKTSSKDASEQIISKMLENFIQKLPVGSENLAKKQGLSLYEAITLASIVEKESGRTALTEDAKQNLQEERKLIAGIFLNRLQIGMPLQSDATVNYATGKNLPSPSESDTKIQSPFNTYLNAGLPPKPISNPSITSIEAVLKPISSEYLYFLHDQKTGKAIYAKTYEKHLENKYKYLK